MQMQVLRKCGLGAREKETLHSDGEDRGLPALACFCSCALGRVRGGTSSMAVSLNREPGLEHQQPRNVLTDYYYLIPEAEAEAEGGLLPCFCHVQMSKVSLRCLYQDVCVT
jgi:hypothetical protein